MDEERLDQWPEDSIGVGWAEWYEDVMIALAEARQAIGEYMLPVWQDFGAAVIVFYRQFLVFTYSTRFPRLRRVWQWLFMRAPLWVLAKFPLGLNWLGGDA